MKFNAFVKGAVWSALLLSAASIAADSSIPNPFASLNSAASGSNSQNLGNQNMTPVPITIPDPPQFEAQSWVLMDYYSGRVICEKNAHERIWPASLTKMMTSYVIGMEIKAGRLHYDDVVTISEDAWSKNYSDSSKMFIEVGKTIKVGDLNRGIIIQSGNDACVAMALHLAGTQEGFVQVMNSYAQRLGLTDTHFANVHGLFDENNYSTAYDMAKLGQALIRDLPEEYAVYKEKEFTFNGIKQYNRNRLLWDTTMNVDGIKTGHLSQVGYNLVASATEGNMRLIAAVIGAGSEKLRGNYCKSLLTYGFRYFEQYIPFNAGKVLLTRDVRMGDASEIGLMLPNDLSLLIPKGRQKDVKVSYRLKSSTFIAPLKKGELLGALDVKLGDQVLASAPLIAANDVAEGGFFGRMWDKLIMFFSSSDNNGDEPAKE